MIWSFPFLLRVMNKAGLKASLEAASAKSGLPLSAESDFTTDTQPITVRVTGLSQLETFHLRAHRSPMAWILDFTFDPFSGIFAKHLNNLIAENLGVIREELAQIDSNLVRLESSLNQELSVRSKSPNELTEFRMRLVSLPETDQKMVTEDQEIASFARLVETAVALIDFIISLGTSGEEPGQVGDSEGEELFAVCKRFERSVRNRIKCLDFYGYDCQACNFSPEAKYGHIGRTITHVHHKTPLSQMEKPGVVDPIKDLVPLCPNCHNLAHKRIPPYSIEEIGQMIKS